MALLVACSDAAGPRAGEPVSGVLQLADYYGPATTFADATLAWSITPVEGVLLPPRVLVAPDTVAAGAAFEVTVTTIGMSGCWAAESQEVVVDDGIVELMPMDVHSGADLCTGAVGFLAHTSTITLDAPGAWTLRVVGRRMRYGDTVWQEPVMVERGVYVR